MCVSVCVCEGECVCMRACACAFVPRRIGQISIFISKQNCMKKKSVTVSRSVLPSY
jgi:hypothetical protein